MLKVVVYDGGWGGEIVADYLGRELNMVEVVRVIDWAHAPYEGKNLVEIVRLAEENLDEYLGKVDAIVLGGYVASQALAVLQQCYPGQKFVGAGVNYERILRSRSYPHQVLLLMEPALTDSELRDELRDNLAHSTLIIPDCSGWEDLINRDLMTRDFLYQDLERDFAVQKVPRKNPGQGENSRRALIAAIRRMEELSVQKKAQEAQGLAEPGDADYERDDDLDDDDYGEAPREKFHPDTVLILSTHFWAIRSEIESLFGWNVRVLDFREKLLRDVCTALKLRGVDGKRSK